MQFKNILALLATASAVGATPFDFDHDFDQDLLPLNSTEFELDERDELTLEERNNGCVKGVHVVAAGGEGTTKGDLGYLQTLVTKILQSVPHSNVHQVPYPAGADPPTSIAYAWPRMKAHIRAYSRKCPRAKMVLAGYSVGGAVVMDSICGEPEGGTGSLGDKYAKHVVATIVYGDPTYVAGLDYDKGSCDGSQGGSDVPRAKPGKCFPFGKHIRSFCDYDDPECCNGSSPTVHFDYPAKYDDRSALYAKNRWHAARKHQKKHNKKHHKKHGGKGGKN